MCVLFVFDDDTLFPPDAGDNLKLIFSIRIEFNECEYVQFEVYIPMYSVSIELIPLFLMICARICQSELFKMSHTHSTF